MRTSDLVNQLEDINFKASDKGDSFSTPSFDGIESPLSIYIHFSD